MILIRAVAVVICLTLVSSALAPAVAREPAARTATVIGVLDAEQEGQVAVKFIPNDSRSAQIIVHNKTQKPLTLKLPDAFAGVPVLAQMGGMGQQGAGFGAGGIGGGQTMGGGGMGGMGGMGGGMGGMGGGGAFSIPPEGKRVIRVMTVCLEHGKPEPSPRLPYRLAELDAFSSDPQLAAVMETLGRGEISQKVAQAAAWHIANGLTWERLAAEKIDHAAGVPDEPFFTAAELFAAQKVVAIVTMTYPKASATDTSASR